MIYTELTCKAARIAYKAHEGAVDGCGMPYIMHPLHVAEQMKDEETTIVALLHDVVEDTDVTLDDLRAQGFPESVITAIGLMTHTKDMTYAEYVARLKNDPIARAVKLADLAHNMDESRHLGAAVPPTEEKKAKWREKYALATKILSE